MRVAPMRLAGWFVAWTVVGLAASVLPVFPRPGTIRERAANWVSAHQSHLPREFSELVLYPRDYRVAILKAQPEAIGTRFWSSALLDLADSGDSLTASQRSLVQQVAEQVLVEGWPPSNSALRDSVAEYFASGAVESFQRTNWYSRFLVAARSDLGFSRAVELLRLHAMESVLAIVTASADLERCNCYAVEGGDFDCPGSVSNKTCLPNTPSPPYLCQENTAGCGFGQTKTCDGTCYQFPQMDSVCPTGAWDPFAERCTEAPIAVDTDGSGIQLTDQAQGVMFDMGGNGRPHRTVWPARGSGTAWLVLDRDGDGAITSAKELFGNVTEQAPSGFPNGFRALVSLDENHDAQLTEADPRFSSLLLWLDGNHDGVSSPGELRNLIEFGIARISLSFRQAGRRDRFGNELRFLASIDPAGATQRWIFDVSLANRLPVEPPQ